MFHFLLGESWRTPGLFSKTLLFYLMQRRFSGNGGFSLRRVQNHYEVCQQATDMINHWPANEDYFWGIYARLKHGFLIPGYREAMQFSMEVTPRHFFRLNQNRLPFGCHAWAKHDPAFWRPFIEQHGYQL